MATGTSSSWAERLKTVARRNRPSQKPQLWENLPLALRRRVEFEVSHRLSADWLDRPRLIALSQVGFGDGLAPLRMEVVTRDAMNKSLFLYGTLEISETRLIQSLLQPGMCFVDVGGNIGYHTLIGARIVGPSGVVHTFEPNLVVRSALSANLERNGLKNVVVHGEAVTRQSGSVRFYKSVWSGNSGISSIIPGDGLSDEGEDVPSISLDDFVATLGHRAIDLLKIDVEGAEMDVIEGGRRTLTGTNAPALLFESFEVEPLLDVLGGLGFHVRRLDYTLANGLELRAPGEAIETIFSEYEPPNYFAVKEQGRFDLIVEKANAKRLPAFHLLGRI
jgi:FkbM family methyltransferase